jgi:hypothetical protein
MAQNIYSMPAAYSYDQRQPDHDPSQLSPIDINRRCASVWVRHPRQRAGGTRGSHCRDGQYIENQRSAWLDRRRRNVDVEISGAKEKRSWSPAFPQAESGSGAVHAPPTDSVGFTFTENAVRAVAPRNVLSSGNTQILLTTTARRGAISCTK